MDETASLTTIAVVAQMERFFCFDHLLAARQPAAAEQVTGWPIISSRCEGRVRYRRPLFADPSYRYGLPGMVIPGVQADFVVFSRFRMISALA